MPLKYKIDVLQALKEKGYSAYALRKKTDEQKVWLSESTIQKLRSGDPISWANICQLCRLLQCQPGDLLEYVDED
jgi:putative transcriptional regulator